MPENLILILLQRTSLKNLSTATPSPQACSKLMADNPPFVTMREKVLSNHLSEQREGGRMEGRGEGGRMEGRGEGGRQREEGREEDRGKRGGRKTEGRGEGGRQREEGREVTEESYLCGFMSSRHIPKCTHNVYIPVATMVVQECV